MNRGLLVVLVFCVFGFVLAAKSPSSVFGDADKESVLQFLNRNRQSDGSFLGLKNTFYATQTYRLLKSDVPKKDQVCEFVHKGLKSLNVEDIFYAASIESSLGCASTLITNSKAIDAVRDVLKSNTADLRELSYAIQTAKILKVSKLDDEVAKATKRLLGLAEEDGQFLPKENSDVGTIYGTGLALESLSLVLPADDETTGKIKNAFKNTRQVFDLSIEDEKTGALTFEDSESRDSSLKVTSQFFSGIVSVSSALKSTLEVDAEQIIGIAQFFVLNKAPSSLESAYYVVKGLKAASKNNIYVPMVLTITESSLSQKSAKPLEVKVTDVLNNPTEKVKVTLTSIKSGSSSSSLVSPTTLEAVKSSASTYSYNLLEKVKTSGVFQLEFNVESEDEKFLKLDKIQRSVKILGSVSVSELKLVISEPNQKDSSVKVGDYPAKLKESIAFGPNKKLNIEFKVKDGSSDKNAKVHQAFVRFSCKCGEEATFVAKYSEKSYSLSLRNDDIGVKVSYCPGNYDMEIIVADFSASNSADWKVGSVDLSFSQPKIEHENPFERRPEIAHQFRAPDKRAGKTLSFLFTLGVLAPFGILLIGWLAVGANIGNFPTGGSSFINAVAFHGCLGAILYLYFSYWIGLTMVSTLSYLAVLVVPTFYFGQRALNYFAKEKQE